MSRKRISKHYLPLLARHSDSFKILDWASDASQQARFEVLAEYVELSGRTLLDVGCGLGDLYGFLSRRNVIVDYTGVDILEKMIAEARRRHPAGRFACADIFAGHTPAGAPFDVVFCSGTFNLNLGNNQEFLPAAIERLLSLSQQTLVINLLHHRTPGKQKAYAYYDPRSVVDLLGQHAAHIRVLDDYLPNDFTVICETQAGK